MNFRSERVSKLIREQLAEMLIREVEFGALVTIMEVDVDKKLEFARVLVSVLPSEKGEKAVAHLQRNAPHFQHMLLKKINIKPMPRIAFELDHGVENAAAVEKIFIENREKE